MAQKRKTTAQPSTPRAKAAQPDTTTEWRKFLRQVEAAGINWNMCRERIFNRLQKTGINHADYDLPETPLELMQRFQEDLRMEVSSSLCSGEKLERLAMAWATKRKDASQTSNPAANKPTSGTKPDGGGGKTGGNGGAPPAVPVRKALVKILLDKKITAPGKIAVILTDFQEDMEYEDGIDLGKVTYGSIRNDKIFLSTSSVNCDNVATIKRFKTWLKDKGI